MKEGSLKPSEAIDCLRPFYAGDLVEIELPDSKTFLNPWIAEETITLVSGERGLGKTWFGLGIAVALSMGDKEFCGWKIDNPARCLYVDGEMSLRSFQKRLISLDYNEQKAETPLFIYSSAYLLKNRKAAINLTKPEDRDMITSFCLDDQVDVMFLDNLASLCPGIDENVKQQYDPINQWLLSLRFIKMAVVLIHHTGKSGTQRGTSAREDNIDNSILITHPPGRPLLEPALEPVFDVFFTKNRCDSEERPKLQKREISMFAADGKTFINYKFVELNTNFKVRQLFNTKKSTREIAETVGVSRRYVQQIFKKMRENKEE